MTDPVGTLARRVAEEAHAGQVDKAGEPCVWWCGLCRCCHTNACPSLFGGNPETPCGHVGWLDVKHERARQALGEEETP